MRRGNFIKQFALKHIYNSCDVIVCLDKSQVKSLKEFGVTARLVVNPLFIDDTDLELAKTRMNFGFKKYSPYYVSAGFDAGRDFSFANMVNSKYPIVTIGRHAPVSYMKYCEILVASKGMVLLINNGPNSSDMSGSTTVFESLCAHKPVFINAQSWLSNYPSKNIYIYKSVEELEKLLNQDIEWINESADFTFGQFVTKMKKVLRIKA